MRATARSNSSRVSITFGSAAVRIVFTEQLADVLGGPVFQLGIGLPHSRRQGNRGPEAAKAALYLAMREAGITNVQLARKLGRDEKEVRRMLDPRHPTKLPRIKEALDLFGKRLVVSVEEAA